MPLFGAWLSDRVLGRYKTILFISLFYCLGHGVLAMADLVQTQENKLWLLYAGLGLISFGGGGIKPCVSAFVGDQFHANQGHLLQRAYGLFYWSINFGSFSSVVGFGLLVLCRRLYFRGILLTSFFASSWFIYHVLDYLFIMMITH